MATFGGEPTAMPYTIILFIHKEYRMDCKRFKANIVSILETMKLVPVSVLEQDLRLASVRNELTIMLADLEDEIEN